MGRRRMDTPKSTLFSGKREQGATKLLVELGSGADPKPSHVYKEMCSVSYIRSIAF